MNTELFKRGDMLYLKISIICGSRDFFVGNLQEVSDSLKEYNLINSKEYEMLQDRDKWTLFVINNIKNKILRTKLGQVTKDRLIKLYKTGNLEEELKWKN